MATQPQTFEVKPTLVGQNVKWELCYTTPDPDECGNSNGNYPDVIIPAHQGTPQAYNFHFKITNDNTGLGLRFAATNPIEIKKGEPTDPAKKQIDQINGHGTTDLRFVDKNTMPNKDHPNAVKIEYGLNFTDKTGKEVTSIDPDITNGGNPGMYQPDHAADLVNPGSTAFWSLMAMMFIASLLAMFVVRMLKFGR